MCNYCKVANHFFKLNNGIKSIETGMGSLFLSYINREIQPIPLISCLLSKVIQPYSGANNL